MEEEVVSGARRAGGQWRLQSPLTTGAFAYLSECFIALNEA